MWTTNFQKIITRVRIQTQTEKKTGSATRHTRQHLRNQMVKQECQKFRMDWSKVGREFLFE